MDNSKELNNKMWKKLIVNEYCECKVENREKVTLTDEMTDETCDMCITCNKEIKPLESDISFEEKNAQDEPEPSEDDFSEAPLLVENDNSAYEQDRYESQTDDRVSMYGY